MVKRAHQSSVGRGGRARSRPSRRGYNIAWPETARCRIFRYKLLAIILASVAVLGPRPSKGTTATFQGTPTLDTLIAWLGDPSTLEHR